MPFLLKSFLTWTLVCVVAAAPSFALGTNFNDTVPGMIVGVAVFIIGYTALSATRLARRMYAERRWRRAIQIGYGTRLAVSILSAGTFVGLPFALMPDILCGFATASAATAIAGDDAGFLFALIATILQGLALNVVLGAYTLIVYAICRATMAPDDAHAPRGFEVLPLATAVTTPAPGEARA